ncbi:MAG: 6-phosphofructokinase, partial [Deltaproteobacteria bacterium]|nr:6-phosphofructokinase [Deltaproteobacteria bacterium]
MTVVIFFGVRIGVLTSGGDAPGMNTALRAIGFVAAEKGIEVIALERGWDGLIDGKAFPLTRPSTSAPRGLLPTREVDRFGTLGGSFIGSGRSQRFFEALYRSKAGERARELGIDGLIVIGGNGSLEGAYRLHTETGLAVVGVPASIDNDIGCTGMAIGVDTALNTIVEACDRISDTARAHRRAFIVEVMGRQSGYLCMA